MRAKNETRNINKNYLRNLKFSKIDPEGTRGPIGLESLSPLIGSTYLLNHTKLDAKNYSCKNLKTLTMAYKAEI